MTDRDAEEIGALYRKAREAIGESDPPLQEGEISARNFRLPVTDADVCHWCREPFAGGRRYVILGFDSHYLAHKSLRSICFDCFDNRIKTGSPVVHCPKQAFTGLPVDIPDESGVWLKRIDSVCNGCGEPTNIPSPHARYWGAWRIFAQGVCSPRCYQRARRKQIRKYGSCINWKHGGSRARTAQLAGNIL